MVMFLKEPVVFYAGDKNIKSFQALNADKTPRDLTGKTFKCQWRRESIADAKLDLEVDTTNAHAGIISIIVDAATSRKMIGTGVCDLQQDDGPTTLVRFDVQTVWDVTR